MDQSRLRGERWWLDTEPPVLVLGEKGQKKPLTIRITGPESAASSISGPALRLRWLENEDPNDTITIPLPDATDGPAWSVQLMIQPTFPPGGYHLELTFLNQDRPELMEVLPVIIHPPWNEPEWIPLPSAEECAAHPQDRVPKTLTQGELRYLEKEVKLIPMDFEFRATHHDFRLLKTYRRRLGRRILHLGCNAGIGSILMARLGYLVHGVDVQPRAIGAAFAIRNAEKPAVARRVTFQCASFDAMVLPAGYFDTVVCFDVLEHLFPEDQQRFFERVEEALVPGGTLILHTPRGKSFPDPSHVVIFEADDLRRLAAGSLTVQRCYPTVEPDGSGNQRLNLVALRPPEVLNLSEAGQKLLERIPSFESSFWNTHYTREKCQERLAALIYAAFLRRPFSMIRIGDMETRFLAFGRIPLGPQTLAEEAQRLELNLGCNPLQFDLGRLRTLQDEFLTLAGEADVLGTHRFTVNREWSEQADRVLTRLGLAPPVHELDVVFNAEILDQGMLLPLLGHCRTLLIGNPAPRFAELLRDSAYRGRYQMVGMPAETPEIAGAIAVPHAGGRAFAMLEELWNEVKRHDFDLALVAASLTGKFLAARIRRELGAVALDIGWSMQFLADVSSPATPSRDPGRRGFKNLFQGRTA